MCDLAVLHRPGLSLNVLKVYLTLASHANPDRGSCFPSKKTIARESGISDLTAVRKAMQRLEACHLITRELRPRSSSLYWLRAPEDCMDVMQDGACSVGGFHPGEVGRINPGDRGKFPQREESMEESTLSEHQVRHRRRKKFVAPDMTVRSSRAPNLSSPQREGMEVFEV